MRAFPLSDITRQHILQAIREIDLRRPELNTSTVYDVVYRGRRYPPLELMRLAHKIANGTTEWALAAGAATNTYLEKLGFSVVQKQSLLLNPITVEPLPELADTENNTKITKIAEPARLTKIQEPQELYQKQKPKPLEKYSTKRALAELFMDAAQLERIQTVLRQKKNIILQGPPGTGKTFLARRLAYLQLGCEDADKVQMVQFHASYSYEDFIMGYRPDNDGKFVLQPGVFYQFCEKAKATPDVPHFFIIEEINRGNLGNIFGELLLLLEADKRGKSFAVALPNGALTFYVPENLFVIATMNTADNALAPLDFAFRRRFGFVKMNPAFNLPFRRFLEYRNTPDEIIDQIVLDMERLNKAIAQDPHLGEGFLIGHSYFCHPPKNGGDVSWYAGIIENELAPLLEEYWSDNPTKAESAIRQLLHH